MGVALFVGRFQPFHNGHLKAIREILKREDSLIVVVGSAQEANTRKNPFSVEERKVMVMRALEEAGLEHVRVISVPDYYDDAKWAEAVRKRCAFDVAYANNSWTERCFRKAGIEVRVHVLHDREDLAGARIRDLIVHGREWKHLVPPSVAAFIENHYGLQRIRKLHG
jgi:nicotinamide-nucleotide adenylyltransferase